MFFRLLGSFSEEGLGDEAIGETSKGFFWQLCPKTPERSGLGGPPSPGEAGGQAFQTPHNPFPCGFLPKNPKSTSLALIERINS